jgi:hypothetical protein
VEYPERTKRIKMLRLLQDELQRAFADGRTQLFVTKIEQLADKRMFGEDIPYALLDLGIHGGSTPRPRVADSLGLSPAECVNLFQALGRNGYIDIHYARDPQLPLSYPPLGIDFYGLTDLGLREIGELPDPEREFMERLDATIQAIREDVNLTESEKQEKIDWLEEGKLLARTLTTEAIKLLLLGVL